MLKAVKIRMEYVEQPTGLGGIPWFGWVLESDRKSVVQKSYQLQIAEDLQFERLVYDSGFVESEESVHVEIPWEKTEGQGIRINEKGKVSGEIQSCREYFVRVRVSDGVEKSPYSDTASFVTGILDRSQWKAGFITVEEESDSEKSNSTCLKKRIYLKGEVESAYVCGTALGLYRFFINGEKAGEDEMTPGWTSYHKHLCYQTCDVTELLKEGENVLEVMLGAGWYKGKMGFLLLRNNYGTRTAFLMQMIVRYKDGREEIFVTDESWQGRPGPVTFSEIYDGEWYDARLESEDEGKWKKVSRIEFPMEALTAQAGSRVRKMEKLQAREVIVTPNRETVIDFGQNLTGWVNFRVQADRGCEIVLKCFETLDAQGNVYTANLRSAKQEIHYICKGDGPEEYHPLFTFMGFRYVQILQWPGEVKAEDFLAFALYSQMEQTGTFRCSNPLVNRLQQNILWGLKGNFLDIPTDCPQRDERVGWTGDAQIFCRTACWLMNTYTFFRKWLKDVAADQTPEGGVPHVVPDIISGKEENDWLLSQGTHSAAAWADVAVINPWTMYLTFGDKTILEEQYESMRKWIDFMKEHSTDYIWNYRLQFGDWVALDAEEGSYFGATPNDLTCTAYFAYSTGLFVKIAGILDRREDAVRYGALHDKIVEKFRRTFFQADGTMTAQTQTAHIVALYFDLVPEAFRAQTARRLTELLKKENGHLVTGFVGTPYFCHALSRNGYVKEAYDLLLKEDFPSWLYQVKMGATTVWEHWDGMKPDGTMWSPDMNSFNHYAYGAVGDWLYRVVLGMEIDEKDPGYHHSIISPQTGDAFDFAEGSYESVYGVLKVRWEKGEAEDVRRLQITIPHNTTAEIRLEKGAEEIRTEGLDFALKEGIFTAQCGSGEWEIVYRKSF
ncbi:MAG: family 78 glycoside hydrolase catalytic domain [Lachnospiraceae bacterium]|nr:alpha-L-rhamnosidase [uncultured Acetatifactor sp.]MCI8286211.1 family 78 glycoside hydrolase catalytic domain [Lachnospiraceae bacterium]